MRKDFVESIMKVKQFLDIHREIPLEELRKKKIVKAGTLYHILVVLKETKPRKYLTKVFEPKPIKIVVNPKIFEINYEFKKSEFERFKDILRREIPYISLEKINKIIEKLGGKDEYWRYDKILEREFLNQGDIIHQNLKRIAKRNKRYNDWFKGPFLLDNHKLENEDVINLTLLQLRTEFQKLIIDVDFDIDNIEFEFKLKGKDITFDLSFLKLKALKEFLEILSI